MFLQRNVNLDFVNGQWVNKDPRFTGINLAENIGYIKYNALQTRGEYRGTQAAHGPLVHAVEGDLQQQRERRSAAGLATNPLDLSVDDGPTNEDRRHNLVMGRLVRRSRSTSSSPASIATTARCRIA